MQYHTRKQTIFWYDLETFGLDSHYDRIAQFAGRRTDLDLNPIGEPIVLYCRVSDDYLPDPLSCLITGIVPQLVNAKGMCESDMIERINEEFSVPGTTVAGFNNIKFDDEFIRNALYRNFLDPYRREWENGCSRWDIIDLVRATYDLRPDGISWPPRKEETGNPTFRLTALTQANGIAQEGAHDALVDINATIAVAKLIKEKQPRLYEYAYALRRKAKVKQVVTTPLGKPFLLTSAFFTTKEGCSRLVMPLTACTDNANGIICFDLSKDTAPLLTATGETIRETEGIFTLSVNKCPFVSPMAVLDDKLAIKLGIDKKKAMLHYRQLKEKPDILLMARQMRDRFEPVNDPDFLLYDGFFPDSDQRRFAIIRKAEPKEKLSLNLNFDDRRCAPLLFRHVCRNWPEALAKDDAAKWKSFCADRILNPPGDIKINRTFYRRKIEERLASMETLPEEKLVLAKLKEYGEDLEKRIFG